MKTSSKISSRLICGRWKQVLLFHVLLAGVRPLLEINCALPCDDCWYCIWLWVNPKIHWRNIRLRFIVRPHFSSTGPSYIWWDTSYIDTNTRLIIVQGPTALMTWKSKALKRHFSPSQHRCWASNIQNAVLLPILVIKKENKKKTKRTCAVEAIWCSMQGVNQNKLYPVRCYSFDSHVISWSLTSWLGDSLCKRNVGVRSIRGISKEVIQTETSRK